MSSMKGLTLFVTDIRNCTTREQEIKRIDKEMAKIRSKFASNPDGYNRKKYVWKLIYMFMLGCDVQFGHMEALKLIASTKYSEKNAGYMACSVMLNENNDILRLSIQTMKKDLQGSNEISQCMALTAIANFGGAEFAESLADDVSKLLFAPSAKNFVRKKAALCLLRLLRKNPEAIPIDPSWPGKLLDMLDDHALGVSTSVMSLILGLVSKSTKGWDAAPARFSRMLTKLTAPTASSQNPMYRYYNTLCPWLQIKLLRALQYFPPPKDKDTENELNKCLLNIMVVTSSHFPVDDPTFIMHRWRKNESKNNSDFGILFEVFNLIIHHCMHGSIDPDLHAQAVDLLGKYIQVKVPNYRYLGLDCMSRLALIPGTHSKIKTYYSIVHQHLRSPDISVRKRALDLLYAMCESDNAKMLVSSLLKYLPTTTFDMREEVVLKTAILAEKFAPDLRWYVDVILQLISMAGDFVADDIWHRVVQVVTNHEELQDYAATTCYRFLSSPSVHENGIKIGSYILGEFGHAISDESVTGAKLLDCLRTKFATASRASKSLILSAYIKLSNTYPELKQSVDEIFKAHKAYVDTEIQQRSCEYSFMNNSSDESLMTMVFEVMPNFPERESALLKRLKKIKHGTTDRDVFTKPKDEKEEDGSSSGSDSEDGESGSDSGSDSDSDSSSDSDSESDDEDEGQFPKQSVDMAQLCAVAKGVVYESSALQIGFTREAVSASSCKLNLFIGNKSTSALENAKLEVGMQDVVKTQLSGEVGTVEGKKQGRVSLACASTRPFSSPLKASLKFSHDGKAQSITLALPILCTSFVGGISTDAGSFIPKWKELAAQSEATKQLKQAIPLENLRAKIKDVMNLTLIDGVVPNPNNICAAGTFSTPTVSMPVLLRLQLSPNAAVPMIKISVKSGHDSLSSGIVGAVCTALGAK